MSCHVQTEECEVALYQGIIPFTVHGGSGLSGTVSQIQKLEPKASVYKNTLSIDRDNVGKSESRITTWLSGLKVK